MAYVRSNPNATLRLTLPGSLVGGGATTATRNYSSVGDLLNDLQSGSITYSYTDSRGVRGTHTETLTPTRTRQILDEAKSTYLGPSYVINRRPLEGVERYSARVQGALEELHLRNSSRVDVRNSHIEGRLEGLRDVLESRADAAHEAARAKTIAYEGRYYGQTAVETVSGAARGAGNAAKSVGNGLKNHLYDVPKAKMAGTGKTLLLTGAAVGAIALAANFLKGKPKTVEGAILDAHQELRDESAQNGVLMADAMVPPVAQPQTMMGMEPTPGEMAARVRGNSPENMRSQPTPDVGPSIEDAGLAAQRLKNQQGVGAQAALG